MDITTVCGHRCNFCWIHNPRRSDPPRPGHMPVPVILRLFDEAAALHVRRITISGDGEPTLHPDFDRISRELHNRKVRTVLTTNAVFPAARQSAVRRFKHLLVNVSAADEAGYRAVHAPRQPDAWQTLLGNLRTLASNDRRRSSQGPRVTLACILNRSNAARIGDLLRFAQAQRISSVLFSLMEPCASTADLQLGPADLARLTQDLGSLAATRVRHNLAHILALARLKPSLLPLNACYIGWINLFVRVDGNVSLCCSNDKLTLGQIGQTSLKDMWSSLRATALRKAGRDKFGPRSPLFGDRCRLCYALAANQTIARGLVARPQNINGHS